MFVKKRNKMKAIIFMKVRIVNHLVYFGVG